MQIRHRPVAFRLPPSGQLSLTQRAVELCHPGYSAQADSF